jgi:hypothetical protein
MNNIYESVQSSLYKVLKDFGAAQVTAGVLTAPPTQYNFDAFSQQNTLPAGDLIGLYSFSLKVDTELATVTCMVAYATDNDLNLFRLNKVVGNLLKKFLPNQRIAIYDSEAVSPPGPVVAYLETAAGTDVSPVYQAQQRPMKMIHFTGKLALALKP